MSIDPSTGLETDQSIVNFYGGYATAPYDYRTPPNADAERQFYYSRWQSKGGGAGSRELPRPTNRPVGGLPYRTITPDVEPQAATLSAAGWANQQWMKAGNGPLATSSSSSMLAPDLSGLLGGGGGLVAVGLLAWLLMGRKR